MKNPDQCHYSWLFLAFIIPLLLFFTVLESRSGPPDPPTGESPPNGSVDIDAYPMLCVDVTDSDGDLLDVTFFGRLVTAEDFTVIALPDTQFYSQSFPEIFLSQTQWIVDSKDERNIAAVTHLGDIVQTGGNDAHWDNAEAAMSVLEDPETTNLEDGIPYGLAVGNHDQSPGGSPRSGSDEGATTQKYNGRFGVHRFEGRQHYGGRYDFGDPETYPDNNDNNFELFSAGDMDFIAIHLEYDLTNTPEREAVLTWLDNVLMVHSDRRAIITTHYMLNTGGSFSGQGNAIYQRVKDNPNVFLMLGGHVWEAARRSDTYQGSTIHSLLSDYQNRGNGWLRIMTFSPDQDLIQVETYSTWLDQYDTGDPHHFTLPYPMVGSLPFLQVGVTVQASSNGTACVPWSGRRAGESYDWFAEIYDGTETTTGPVWTFTSNGECSGDLDCLDMDPCTEDFCIGGVCEPPPAYDGDRDGVCEDADNCKRLFNPGQVDDDGDGLGNLCDICPEAIDPWQYDSDEDGAGDACDCQPIDPNDREPAMIDRLIVERDGETSLLSWTPALGADIYSITRGELSSLAPGEYGPCFANGIQDTSYDDTELPEEGDGFFYLIQAQNYDCGMGSLGYTSSETIRENLDPLACNGHMHSDNYAFQERSKFGIVTGTLTNTTASDDIRESIREEVTEVPSLSRLEHRWLFNVTGGSAVEFHVEGYRTNSTDGDDFRFEHSADGQIWQPIDLVSLPHSDNGIDLIAILPEDMMGLHWIRVVDTDRTPGNASADTVTIDEMFIRSIP
jgi:hypothetical protein